MIRHGILDYVIPTTTVPSTLLTGLRAYYKMDETEGTTTYDSTGTYNGEMVNSPTLNGAGIKLGYTFNISDSERTRIPVAVSSFGTSDFSIACWFKVPDFLGAYYIFGNYHSGSVSYIRTYTGTNELIHWHTRWNTSSVYCVTRYTINPETWYHLVCVADRDGNSSIYLDGSLVQWTASISAYSAIDQTSSGATYFSIGSGASSSGNYWKGEVDEFGLWERLLTQDEIDQLYNSGNGLTYPF